MRRHFILTNVTSIAKNQMLTNVVENMERLKPSYIAGRKKWYSHFGKTILTLLQNTYSVK